jgi:hypothetical protein
MLEKSREFRNIDIYLNIFLVQIKRGRIRKKLNLEKIETKRYIMLINGKNQNQKEKVK